MSTVVQQVYYTAQYRRRFVPFWFNLGGYNSFSKIEYAKEYIKTFEKTVWESIK